MLHDLTIGHLDVEAVKRGQLRVVRPLSATAASVLARFVDAAGLIGGQPFEATEEYICLPWYRPGLNTASVRAALELMTTEGCVAADVRNGRLVDAEQLRRR
jgi:hypothetical protein